MTIPDNILNADSTRLLETVFRHKWLDAWVCWSSNMKGKRVRDLIAGDLPLTEDCYFCIATMKDEASGRSARNADLVHAVVIDDVGTKVDKGAFDEFATMFDYAPTWVLETSKGNFHYGYAINGGIDPIGYRVLRISMADHPIWGKSDNAMDPVHLYRLPQGVNTKNGWRVS